MTRLDLAVALQEWNVAQRRRDEATGGGVSALDAEVVRTRGRFQDLSAQHTIMLLDKIHKAETRRQIAVPSTPPFHAAAKDEMAIALEIWESARMSDQDSPQRDS
ncbi:MAG: hypothetical protein ABI797_03020 [Chloroflexota bacterium]